MAERCMSFLFKISIQCLAVNEKCDLTSLFLTKMLLFNHIYRPKADALSAHFSMENDRAGEKKLLPFLHSAQRAEFFTQVPAGHFSSPSVPPILHHARQGVLHRERERAS